jgi:hypothetical protein
MRKQKQENRESGIERLGRYMSECEHADILFNALAGSAHSDVVHIDIITSNANWKIALKNDLIKIKDSINEWFFDYPQQYYMLMFGLERIKRKFRIDFDEESLYDDKPNGILQ